MNKPTPRTLNSAFGPYTSHALDEMPEPPKTVTALRIVLVLLSCVMGIALILFLALGGLSQ